MFNKIQKREIQRFLDKAERGHSSVNLMNVGLLKEHSLGSIIIDDFAEITEKYLRTATAMTYFASILFVLNSV